MFNKEVKAMKAYLESIQCVDPEKIQVKEDEYYISCQALDLDTTDIVCLNKHTGQVLITSYQAVHVRDLMVILSHDEE